MRLLLFFTLLSFSFAAQIATVVRGPYLQTPTPNSIIVKWRSNIATNSTVWYGPDTTNLSSMAVGNSNTTDHTVTITGLPSSSNYFYAVGGQQIYGGNTSKHRFKTNPVSGSQDSIRIWAIGDFGKGNAGQIAVKSSYLNWTGNQATDVWMWLGDNVYNDGKDAEYQSKLFGLNGFSDIFYWLPFMPTPGNHDYNEIWAQSAFLGIPYSNIPLENHEGPYFDIVDVPEQAEAGGYPSNLEVFYSYDYGNVHFISLNSEVFDFLQTGTGVQRMIDYIHDDLSQNQQDFTIAYFHQPPYSKGSHDSDGATELVMKTMREDVVPVLESYNVDLVVCGHSHVFERSYLIKDHFGNSSTWNPATNLVNGTNGKFSEGNAYVKDKFATNSDGTVYVVCGNSGSENNDGTMNHPVFHFGDNGSGIYGSFIMDVYRNRLDAKYLRSNGQILDEFTILKKNLALQSSTDTICIGETIILQSSISGGSDSLDILWNNGSSENQLSVSPSQTTSYQLTVTDNLTGQQATATYEVVVNDCIGSIDESTLPFSVFPNPTSDFLQIQSEAVIRTIHINDDTGRELRTLRPNSKAIKIDVSKFPSGMYTLKINIGGKNYVKKIIVE
jgi:hypothetical protein